MKKVFLAFLLIIFCLFYSTNNFISVTARSPFNAMQNEKSAEKILYDLQNSSNYELENNEIDNLLGLLYNNNTLFYNYKISEIENLLQVYREAILKQAKKIAQEKNYKKAVELLQSKACLFKDKSTINSLISYYSKFFVQDGLFYYESQPLILSLGKLIAYPEQAFLETNNLKLKDNLTAGEFQNLLKQLYNENYILINIENCFNLEQNTPSLKDLYLPQNKKPLILIFNDTNYDNSQGFIEKYIVDPQDEIACYNSKEIEKNIISYNTDLIPILENFITLNKDFSFNGARATICFCENEKTFGYNISKQNPNQTQEILNLKKIVSKLKEKGYCFSYSGKINNLTDIEYQNKKEILADLKQIFGEINMFYCKNCNYNQINSTIYGDFGIKILLGTIKTNSCVVKNNYIVFPINEVTINQLNSENFPISNLDYDDIYDHINRKKLN